MQSRNWNWLLPAIALSGAVVAGGAIQRTGASHPAALGVPQNATGLVTSSPMDEQKLASLSSKLQLGFEPNRGQAELGVNFVTRGRGYSLFLKPGEAELVLPSTSAKSKQSSSKAAPSPSPAARRVRIALKGANRNARGRAKDELSGKVNYIFGGDPSKWRKDVPSFAKVQYDAVYPGIDLVYYGTQGRLEYDFMVEPGSNPELVNLSVTGADSIRLDRTGDLVLAVDGAEIRQGRPVAYQEIAGVRKEVSASYEMRPDHTVGFRIGGYDTTRPLVVDPYISYSSYLGKNGTDEPSAIVTDATGIYVVGTTTNPWFTSANATTDQTSYKTTFGGSYDIFLTKMSLDGQHIIYSTYYGGNGADRCNAIAVDAASNVYLTGRTSSGVGQFPAVNAWQAGNAGGNDAYLVKLGPTGNTVIFSSWLGGSGDDEATSVKLDASGNGYVVGFTRSTNIFPAGIMTGVAQNASKGDLEIFVAKIAASGGSGGRLLGTYLGGSKADVAYGVAVDSAGYVYVVGATQSDSIAPGSIPYPTTPGALYPTSRGSTDVIITKLNADFSLSTSGGRTPFSTHFGGSQVDVGNAIEVDASGNIYFVGTTGSSAIPAGSLPYPTQFGYQSTYTNVGDAVLTKLDNNGGLLYSTYFGAANNQEVAYALSVNNSGLVWVGGYTKSTSGFPIRNALPNQTTYRGGNSDGFIARFDTTKSGDASLLSSSFYGGNLADEIRGLAPIGEACDTVYVYGSTTSTSLLPVINAYQSAKATVLTDTDAFLAKLDETPPPVANAGPDQQIECNGGATNSATLSGSVTSGGTAPFTYTWTEGASTIATGANPTVSLTLGVHTIVLKVQDACYSISTDTVIVTVSDTTPPTINSTPGNVVLPNDLHQCYAIYNPGSIAATDTCSSITYSAVASPGNQVITPNTNNTFNIDPAGDADTTDGTTTYTITWKAQDSSGNFSTSISTVTVSDTESPVFAVPPTTITTAASPGALGTFVNPGTPTATDNCTLIALYGFRDNPGLPDTGDPADLQGQYPLGTSVITWLAIDEAFNYTESYQTVTVTGSLSVSSTFDSTSFGPARTFTADAVSDTFTSSGHGFKSGNPVQVKNTGGSLPAGLNAGTTYYVISPTTVGFKLAATVGGTAINITTAGSGTNVACQVLNDGTDGWTLTASTRSYLASGGNPDGHIRGSDSSASSSLWYFRAPAKFRGNRYAGTVALCFDLRRNTGTAISNGEDVVLVGGGLTIYATLGGAPPQGSWQSYNLAVDTSVAWKVKPGGATATAAQIRQVLESLQDVKVRGKWNSTATAEGDIDNVALKLTY